MVQIDVSILLEYIKNLPPFSKWKSDKFVCIYAGYPTKRKNTKVIFIKNYKTYQWDLYKIKNFKFKNT
jgi:hypothetical protein